MVDEPLCLGFIACTHSKNLGRSPYNIVRSFDSRRALRTRGGLHLCCGDGAGFLNWEHIRCSVVWNCSWVYCRYGVNGCIQPMPENPIESSAVEGMPHVAKFISTVWRRELIFVCNNMMFGFLFREDGTVCISPYLKNVRLCYKSLKLI